MARGHLRIAGAQQPAPGESPSWVARASMTRSGTR